MATESVVNGENTPEAAQVPETPAVDPVSPSVNSTDPLPRGQKKPKYIPKNPHGRPPSHTPTQIDEAMTKCGGNRKEAAAMLGLTVPQLRTRMHQYRTLQEKWSPHTLKKKEAFGADVLDPVGRYFQEAYEVVQRSLSETSRVRAMLLSRIERHHNALETGDVAEMAKNCFKVSEDGTPSEERMVLEAFNAAGNSQRMIAHEYRAAVSMKLEFVLRMKGAQGQGGDGIKRAKPGFKPKGVIELNTQDGGNQNANG